MLQYKFSCDLEYVSPTVVEQDAEKPDSVDGEVDKDVAEGFADRLDIIL